MVAARVSPNFAERLFIFRKVRSIVYAVLQQAVANNLGSVYLHHFIIYIRGALQFYGVYSYLRYTIEAYFSHWRSTLEAESGKSR